jgi:hypothetical protein
MIDIQSDFGHLYRRAMAERDPEQKSALLRRVQELLDCWAQGMELAGSGSQSTHVSLPPESVTRDARIHGRGAHERSLSSAA